MSADFSVLAPLFADIEKVEQSLGLPEGFVLALLEGDDWSQVIKSHAVLEATLQTVVASAAEPSVGKIFEGLAFAGGRTNKIKVIETLDLLPKEAVQFLVWHSELRNRLVHGVEHLNFDMATYFSSLGDTEVRRLARLIARVALDVTDDRGSQLSEDLLRNLPKLALLVGVIGVMARCLFRMDHDAFDAAREAAEASAVPIVLSVLLIAIIYTLKGKHGDFKTGKS